MRGRASLLLRRGGLCKLVRDQRGWACWVLSLVFRVLGLRISTVGNRLAEFPSLEGDWECRLELREWVLCQRGCGRRTRGSWLPGRIVVRVEGVCKRAVVAACYLLGLACALSRCR